MHDYLNQVGSSNNSWSFSLEGVFRFSLLPSTSTCNYCLPEAVMRPAWISCPFSKTRLLLGCFWAAPGCSLAAPGLLLVLGCSWAASRCFGAAPSLLLACSWLRLAQPAAASSSQQQPAAGQEQRRSSPEAAQRQPGTGQEQPR